MIRPCNESDFQQIWSIINDGADAYRGVIPADRWTIPYMSTEKLQHEIAARVAFWGYEVNGALAGVMGIQAVQDVHLIRHAYVRTANQKQGIGGRLLTHLRADTQGPILVGTWAAATWAIHFYERHGFQITEPAEKERLLRKYWVIPDRQIETSVVLIDTGRPASSAGT